MFRFLVMAMVLSFSASIAGGAELAQFPETQHGAPVNTGVMYYTAQGQTIEAVRSAYQRGEFRPTRGQTNFGYSKNDFWFHVALQVRRAFVEIDFEVGRTYDVFYRIASYNVIHSSARLYQVDEYRAMDHRHQWVLGLYYLPKVAKHPKNWADLAPLFQRSANF